MALPAVEDLEKVLFATQLVCELDHLESQPAGTQAPRGEHDERPDNHSPTRPVQRLGRNHRTKRTPSEGGVLAASETGFGRYDIAGWPGAPLKQPVGAPSPQQRATRFQYRRSPSGRIRKLGEAKP